MKTISIKIMTLSCPPLNDPEFPRTDDDDYIADEIADDDNNDNSHDGTLSCPPPDDPEFTELIRQAEVAADQGVFPQRIYQVWRPAPGQL